MTSLRIFQVATITLFTGRGWKYLLWDAPFRSILWSEDILKSFLESYTQFSWQEYVSSSFVDSSINLVVLSIGIIFLLLACLSSFLKPSFKKGSKLLFVGAFLLLTLVLIQFISRFFYLGIIIEHAVQIGTPLIFYCALHKSLKINHFVNMIKIFLGLTFVGHALFAIGFHPVPGSFIDMVISILGVEEAIALKLLIVAGTLDILASLLLFSKKTEKYALYFMIFWGSFTSLARIFAHMSFDLFFDSANQWFLETLYRLPHALIPLGLILLLIEKKKASQISSEISLSTS